MWKEAPVDLFPGDGETEGIAMELIDLFLRDQGTEGIAMEKQILKGLEQIPSGRTPQEVAAIEEDQKGLELAIQDYIDGVHRKIDDIIAMDLDAETREKFLAGALPASHPVVRKAQTLKKQRARKNTWLLDCPPLK